MRKYEGGDTMEMKEIKEYPNYFITDDGRVWSKNRNKFLSLNPNTQGYLKVSLWKDGKSTTKPVHRLVAETFIPNPNNFLQVNHKDENKLNNSVENLEWCSEDYNTHYGTRNQRIATSKGKRTLCIETGIIYPSVIEASRQTKIPFQNIWKVCKNINHKAGGFHWQFVN